METEWMIDRQHLRTLLGETPALTYTEMAVQVGRSLSWVKKWAPRLRVNLKDDRLLERRRSPRHYGQPSRSEGVIEKILAIRDEPPDHLRRTPGPRAILYYLNHDPDLQQTGVRLPRSTRTIWQVLVDYHRIPKRLKPSPEPLPLVSPMQHWQFDFKDATTAQDEATDKQAHQVEILNIVDAGTSLVVDHHVRSDFNAETAIQALAATFVWQGLPQTLTFDRDPRFVGSQQTRDFPSALVRFLHCLGIRPIICPPHRPDKNAYVERYHRSLKAEALQVERPATLEATQQCIDAYCVYRFHRRPHLSSPSTPRAGRLREKNRGSGAMEEEWVRDRSRLPALMQEQPTGSVRQYAATLGRSRKWVQKWKKRFMMADPHDLQVLMSQSRARKTQPEPYPPAVIARILELRDEPPAAVPRRLGAPAILYYLHHDQNLQAQGLRLPRSTSTIWKILDAHQRILRFQPAPAELFERPAPLDTWEIDFTDVSSAVPVSEAKRQHWVEALAVVDRGTSILVDLQAASDYQAPSALRAIASTLRRQGLPQRIVLDRDPRWVGSWSSDQFPSAFMRFLLCLGVQVEVCPPQRPDRKPFVERYFRTLQEECVNVYSPATAMAAQAVFEAHQALYNHERPNQARACGNQPPYVAFPRLPILPSLPDTVDPDH